MKDIAHITTREKVDWHLFDHRSRARGQQDQKTLTEKLSQSKQTKSVKLKESEESQHRDFFHCWSTHYHDVKDASTDSKMHEWWCQRERARLQSLSKSSVLRKALSSLTFFHALFSFSHLIRHVSSYSPFHDRQRTGRITEHHARLFSYRPFISRRRIPLPPLIQ